MTINYPNDAKPAFSTLETPLQPAEPRRAVGFILVVWAALLAAKSLAGLPYVGAAALAGAAFLQLWIPLTRCDAWKLAPAVLGLDERDWANELRVAAALAAVVLPLYGAAQWLVLTHGRDSLAALWAPTWLPRVPVAVWHGLPMPTTVLEWGGMGLTWVNALLTHVIGVALPEETFFRGYVQPQLAYLLPPRHRVGGVPLGAAAVLACAAFALGHFIGEWDPTRLLPFFPGLLFAWQRNRRASLVGCIALHTACNLFSAGFAACFVPGGPAGP